MKNVKSLFLKGGFICAFMFSALSSSAENYPYRSDVLWVTVPDHADWLYKTGEKAEVEVQFYKYGIPQDGVEVKYELGGDMMPADKTGSVKLKNGRAVINVGTMKNPGFCDCRLVAVVNGKRINTMLRLVFLPRSCNHIRSFLTILISSGKKYGRCSTVSVEIYHKTSS